MRHALPQANQFGRKVHHKLIHQPFTDQRAIELLACLNMQFVDLALSQVVQHGPKVHFAICTGLMDYFCALHFKSIFSNISFICGIDEYCTVSYKNISVQWRFQATVHHHQMRLAGRVCQPHIELGVVCQHGANASQHRAGASAPGMAIGAGSIGRDPLAAAIFQGGSPVQRCGNFHPHPGGFANHPAEKPNIEFARLHRTGTNFHFNACCPQSCKTFSTNQGVGIGNRGEHLFNACTCQCIAAGPRAALMRARFQRHVSCSTRDRVAPKLGILQGHDFSMGAARALGVALAKQLSIWRGNHAAHARVGRGKRYSLGSQRQGLVH